MCGIAGWVGNEKRAGPSVDKVQLINKILDDQTYRGPDARGVWKDDSNDAVFGHNRLSIVELSDAGAQPMVSADGRWIISYNGELYNYKNLRERLVKKFGVSFKGNSDTEVFLYGFIHFGIDELLRFADGMFAAAIFDKKNKQLYLIRDRVGEKPLFYCKNSEGVFFASELKSLAKNVSGCSENLRPP